MSLMCDVIMPRVVQSGAFRRLSNQSFNIYHRACHARRSRSKRRNSFSIHTVDSGGPAVCSISSNIIHLVSISATILSTMKCRNHDKTLTYQTAGIDSYNVWHTAAHYVPKSCILDCLPLAAQLLAVEWHVQCVEDRQIS